MERADSGGDQQTFEDGKWLRFAEEFLSPSEDMPNCGERADKLRWCRMKNTIPALFRKPNYRSSPYCRPLHTVPQVSSDPRVHFIILGSLRYFLTFGSKTLPHLSLVVPIELSTRYITNPDTIRKQDYCHKACRSGQFPYGL